MESNYLAQFIDARLNKPIPQFPYVVVYNLPDGWVVSEAPFSFSSLTTVFFTHSALALFGLVHQLYRNGPLDSMDPSSPPI